MRPGLLQRIRLRLLHVLDQLFMILNLPTFTSSLDGRLRKLRRLYYQNPKISIQAGQVRDILHGHVGQRYRPYYEQLMAGERRVYQYTRNLPRGMRGDELLCQTQQLGERIAILIEDVQAVPHLSEDQQRLQKRVEEALLIQATIVEQLVSLDAAQADRQVDRAAQRIQRLTNFLGDVEATYAELDEYDFLSGVDND